METRLTTINVPSDNEKLCWLRLCRTESIGPLTFAKLITRFGTAEKALEGLPELAIRGGKKAPISLFPTTQAKEELEKINQYGASLILSCNPSFPPLLRETQGHPPLLTAKGDLSLLFQRCFAVVGARNASLSGKKIATDISRQLGEAGWIISSGLARGIDACAHKASLPSGTIAVLPGGIDDIYPSENEDLYHNIAEQGLILAESPFGTKPQAKLFPKRNRIISGLSHATLVVEAGLKSGSLVTARYALEQGRDVFAIPGCPLDPRARGTNQLLRQGAILTESYKDIERELFTVETSCSELPQPQENPMEIQDSELGPARKILMENLNFTPITVDNLIEEYHIPSTILWTLLLELEVAGRLNRQPGGYISLKPDQSTT